MALKKNIPTNYGADASYWKISRTNIDWHSKRASVELLGFTSQEAREAGKEPITRENYAYMGDGFEFTPEENAVAKAYVLIKGTEQFADAEDC